MVEFEAQDLVNNIETVEKKNGLVHGVFKDRKESEVIDSLCYKIAKNFGLDNASYCCNPNMEGDAFIRADFTIDTNKTNNPVWVEGILMNGECRDIYLHNLLGERFENEFREHLPIIMSLINTKTEPIKDEQR